MPDQTDQLLTQCLGHALNIQVTLGNLVYQMQDLHRELRVLKELVEKGGAFTVPVSTENGQPAQLPPDA